MRKLLASLHPVIEAFLISFFEIACPGVSAFKHTGAFCHGTALGNRRQATFADGDKQDPVKAVKIC
jgi:hypothetical protein